MTPAKGFAEMKDSGIHWMGRIPNNWKLIRAKFHFTQTNNRGNETPILLAASQKYGVCPQSWLEGVVQVSENTDLQQFKTVHKNDFVISLRSFQGGFERSDFEGVCSPAYQVFHADNSFDNNFLKYLFKNELFIDEMNSLTVGIREGRNIKYEDFANSLIFVPPLDEQTAIASYLDAQCAKIDEIIAQAKASIEDYKQWKASIIYEAVTQGLDPNVEMKDSGIEWIPLLPTAIKVSRVGLHFSIILGKMLCPKPLDDTYTLEPYFCAANVHFSGVDSENLKEMWFNPDEKERYRVAPGDLLVVEGGAGAGGCAVIETVDFPIYIQNSIMIVRSKRKNNVKYLKYFLETLVGRGYIDFACNKATIPHFTKEKLSAVPFPVFDCDTQARIVDFLDSKCGKIDDLIFQKQSLIDDLESYKKSLICEVVTGKRRVV